MKTFAFVLLSLIPVVLGQFEIIFDQLNGGPLPGGRNDRILVQSVLYNGTEECGQVNDDKVAVELNIGEFVSDWKALVLEDYENDNIIRWSMEMEGSTRPFKMILNRETLALNRLCFWREVGGLFNPRECLYRISDGFEAMDNNYLYRFYWLSDQ